MLRPVGAAAVVAVLCLACADTDGSRSAATGSRGRVVGVPPSVLNPTWLDGRRRFQLASLDSFQVFHDFAFSDQVAQSGIQFRNKVVIEAAKGYKAIHYDHGNGVVIADVDGDGLYDIYFVTQVGGNELWKNVGGGRFENVTDQAGVAVAAVISITASFADIDNDGDADLYVTTLRSGNRLFENDGSGKFTDITAQSGLGYQGHSSSAVFFDYDRDGLLDVFLTVVGVYTRDSLITVTAAEAGTPGEEPYQYYLGVEQAFSGHLRPERTEQSILFKNLGRNRFADVSEETGLVDTGWAGDASAIDGNNDGWPDLYVLSMQGLDEYYENVNGKRFVRKSREVFPRTPWGAMGIKVFDYDNDGLMDLYLTDMHSDMVEVMPPDGGIGDKLLEKFKAQREYPAEYLNDGGMGIYGNAFYRNEGGGRFTEISDEIGVENFWPWGLSVGDLNADGYEDIFIVSGMNYPFRYGLNSVLLNNRGAGFLDSEFILGVEPRQDETATPWFTIDCALERDHPACEGQTGLVEVWGARGTRSSVIFDLDNDGDLDIVTNEFNARPMVLISNLAQQRGVRFLNVLLVGTASNRNGLGARVSVRVGSKTYTKVFDGNTGHLSHSLPPLYFGLDDAETVDQIEIVWPSGREQVITGPIEINRVIEVTER